MSDKKILSKEQLRGILGDEQYVVCCEQGTEALFSGKYWNTKTAGIYHCVCCNAPLFSSQAKFDSGTGWPSFWEPVAAGAVSSKEDRSKGMLRMEVCCAACGSHLGHVFADGPEPTGLRYCINSVSLNLVTG
ncbi:MAG TPA: peptide-methionine (R)-S-oxide reductase [Thiolapillus brandeum]|uniref:Peptide methionine sulfoxide reductase MsrB n=1 Tax=Thiolapillus brandeum TaxID=1076588 RepID=A0A831K4Y1_9GAMM|nr:peptide-methionine (R)-S-oxide reductase [Thiolapillus brandeum]